MGAGLNFSLSCTGPDLAFFAARVQSAIFAPASVAVSDFLRPHLHTIMFLTKPDYSSPHLLLFLQVFLPGCPVDGTALTRQTTIGHHFMHVHIKPRCAYPIEPGRLK